jgi:hypothetical protein
MAARHRRADGYGRLRHFTLEAFFSAISHFGLAHRGSHFVPVVGVVVVQDTPSTALTIRSGTFRGICDGQRPKNGQPTVERRLCRKLAGFASMARATQ